jgi:hypothetical protein
MCVWLWQDLSSLQVLTMSDNALQVPTARNLLMNS